MEHKHTPAPWSISWYICRVDADDVKAANLRGETDKKIGDEMWRVPLSIGGLSVSHCHWAGNHIDCTIEDAYLISAAPELLEALEELINQYECEKEVLPAYYQALAAIAKARGEA